MSEEKRAGHERRQPTRPHHAAQARYAPVAPATGAACVACTRIGAPAALRARVRAGARKRRFRETLPQNSPPAETAPPRHGCRAVTPPTAALGAAAAAAHLRVRVARRRCATEPDGRSALADMTANVRAWTAPGNSSSSVKALLETKSQNFEECSAAITKVLNLRRPTLVACRHPDKAPNHQCHV